MWGAIGFMDDLSDKEGLTWNRQCRSSVLVSLEYYRAAQPVL